MGIYVKHLHEKKQRPSAVFVIISLNKVTNRDQSETKRPKYLPCDTVSTLPQYLLWDTARIFPKHLLWDTARVLLRPAGTQSSAFFELGLRSAAYGASPAVGEFLKGNGAVIHIAADLAHILACGLFFRLISRSLGCGLAF